MRETLELMLRVAEEDGPDSLAWPHAALERLPAADVEWLMCTGFLAEVEPDTGLVCPECEEACRIEPTRVADGGRTRAFHLCQRSSEHGGPIWFEMDAMRRWELRMDRLARLVARSVEAVGRIVEVRPGRLYLLGMVKIDGNAREIFLARGVAWPDATEAFGRASRLRTAAAPAVLALASVAVGDFLPGHPLPARPLVEIAKVGEDGLTVHLDGAFPDVLPGQRAKIQNEPISLDAFMARCCEKRSRELRRFRRLALLSAARNGKVALPPEAVSHRSGQVANKLKSFRRRVLGGQYLDYEGDGKHGDGRKWGIYGRDSKESKQ
jgi:hypothetical protein